MKKIFLLLVALSLSMIGFSQLRPEVVKDGLKVGRAFPKVIVSNELKTLQGIDTTKTIKEQFDETVNIADSVAGYTAAEVDLLLKRNGSRKIFPNTGRTYAFPYSHTGDLTETTVLTDTIPIGSVGIWGSVNIIVLGSSTNAATNHYIKIYFNGTLAGTGNMYNSTSGHWFWKWYNKGSLTSQVCLTQSSSSGGNIGASTAGVVNPSFDFGTDIVVTVTLQLATTSTDNISLQMIECTTIY